MTDLTYRMLTDDADLDAFARIASLSFGEDVATARRWIACIGLPHARIVTSGGRVVGGLCLLHMGQWFGGRAVPMSGISSVAVDPAERGRGVARHLMREAVRELHASGIALSTLSASTQPLYRSVGYEHAGLQCKVNMQTSRLFTTERTLRARTMADADHTACDALHHDLGRVNPGTLARNDAIWGFVRSGVDPDKDVVHGFVLEGDEGIAGYVHYKSKGADGGGTLILTDVCVTSTASARSMLSFLRDHRSMVNTIAFRGHPTHPLLLAAREQRHQVTLWDTWMLRLVHVRAALESRGYSRGVQAEIEFDVVDDLLPENAGRCVLRVAHGRGDVVAGGSGRLRIDVRVLASLYSGYISPQQAATGFGLECGEDEAARLAAVFAGPCPWMSDSF